MTAPGYLPGAGEAIRLTAGTVAREIGAEHCEIPRAAHEAHHDQPAVNQLLDRLWRAGSPSA
jgi:hypothetical protein